ncbi:glycosyltransferase family 4 protein [Nitratireductor mangrovi]|uniref:Glycosyltransferase family 4 protein n=1 Tax=Nitratireductor mangrovi TaxID=2599600 RepID=A0A5B8KYT7_9HYPH|nr:glycosyltransferase family 4 protein [Nitratireductor mangrovi]QDZ00897.1 glycosyltransferase family 4 protein [Nitratireductor mangrovi]
MTSSLRIVHCFRSPVGGIFRHVRDLSEAQVAAGHQVGIVCDSTTGGDYEAQLFEQIADRLPLGVARTPMQRHIGPGDLASAARTFRLIKKLQPDILHGHGAKGGVYARVFGSMLRVSRSRVARLYSPHGGSLHYDEKSLTGRFFFLLEAMMARWSDHLLFVSEEERSMFRRKVGEPRAPHTVVYNGIREEEFEPVPANPDAADFLYIGMMRNLKGPDLFIEALAQAEKRLGRRLSAVMVGDGDDRERCIARVAELGLADRARFLMPMPARKAFALARAVVVPSRAEAMPYIVIEALGAGKPMIVSAVGGIPEIFAEATTALVQPDADAIATKMAEALSDETTYATSMPGRDFLKDHFSAPAMAAKIEKIYFDALAKV